MIALLDGPPQYAVHTGSLTISSVNLQELLHRKGSGMAWRIGVDIGGTFTDVALIDDASGSIGVAKVPTTPAISQRA